MCVTILAILHRCKTYVEGSEAPWKANPLAGLPLFELYKHLGPLEMQFFTMLDAELDKVDSFYTQKESEFQARTKLLIEQFGELNDHRRMVVVSVYIF
jgi:hypothetical protein